MVRAFPVPIIGQNAASSAQVIDGSLRFNGVNQHLTRTFQSGGNRRTFTLSYWIKEHGKGTSPYNNPHILWSGSAVETRGGMVHRGTGSGDANRIYMFNQVSNSTNSAVWTNSLHRDFSAWKHIVFKVDSTISSPSTNRVLIYVNGVEQEDEYKTTPTQNLDFQINLNQEHRIGRGIPDDYGNFSLSQYYFIDGQALAPSNFAFTDPLTGTWRPKKYEGTFGTTGFWLPFDGNTPIGEDQSGNNNDWTAQNFNGTVSDPDVLKDSPSGAAFGGPGSSGITTTSSGPSNYATLNPLNMHNSNNSFSNGNLEFTTSGSDGGLQESTLAMSSGKFYFEVVYSRSGTGQLAGIRKPGARNYTDSYIYVGTGNKYTDGGSSASYGDSLSHGDVIGTAFDADNGTLEFFKNGVSQGQAFSGISGTYSFFVGSFGGPPTGVANFGQKPFKHVPPQGFLPLNSANTTSVTVTPRPDKFQLANSFTAAGGNQIITFGFKPDLIISKSRTQSYAWDWEDIVRGGGFKLRSNAPDAQVDYCTNAPIREWRTDGVRCSTNMNATYGSGNSVSYGFVAGGNEIPNYGAISFDGTGDYLTLASTSAFRGHSGYTIDGWVYIIGAPANNNGYIIFDTGSGGSDPELNVLADGSGNLQLYDSLSNNSNWDGGAPYMQRYRWHYFKQTVEGTADDDSAAVNKLYIDGQLGVQNTVNLSGRTASSTAAIGGRTNGTVLATMILSNLRYRSVVDNSTDIPTEPFTSDSDTVLLCCNGIAPGSGNADPTDSTTTPSSITKNGNPGNANIDIFGRFTKDGVQYSSASAAGLATGGSNITPTAASIGTKTGFSIVTWNTESLSGTKSVDTGLGKKPDFVITKVLDQSDDWLTFHNGISSTESFILNGNRDKLSNAAYAHTFNDDGTISGLPVGGSNWWISNRTYVFYSWCNIPGKQKFGAYEANNDADGPFIELGFRPAILWVKRADATGSWYILDNKRDTFNRVYKTISPNQTATEDTTTGATDYCDFLSNGFKPRIAEGSINDTNTYCYCAWAESPFSNLYGGQSLGR